MPHLDLSDLPDDPLEALAHLLDLDHEVEALLEDAYARTYFALRMTGNLDAAFDLGRHSRTRILAMIRARNLPGRAGVTWGDGLDTRSSAYSGD